MWVIAFSVSCELEKVHFSYFLPTIRTLYTKDIGYSICISAERTILTACIHPPQHAVRA